MGSGNGAGREKSDPDPQKHTYTSEEFNRKIAQVKGIYAKKVTDLLQACQCAKCERCIRARALAIRLEDRTRLQRIASALLEAERVCLDLLYDIDSEEQAVSDPTIEP